MTADEARERVGEMRRMLARVMRALSVPNPDWKAAMEAASECERMGVELEECCFTGYFERRKSDGDR